MRNFKVQHSVPVCLAVAIMAAVGFYVVLPRVSHPEPNVNTWLVSAGGVSRAIVQDKTPRGRNRRGGLSLSYLPNHIDFQSSGGPADVYVVRLRGSVADEVTQMQKVTEQLQAGQPPEKAVAKGSGQQGFIRVNWQPYGTAKYLVLVRCEQESEVTLVVHYGP